MKIRKIIISIYILITIGFSAFSQDINFMMYSNTSLNVNPALISSSDDFKISGSYKNINYINDVTAQSTYIMITRPLYKNDKRFGGFGFSVLSDKGGNIQQLSYQGITGAYAHEIQLTSWSRLSLGLQASYLMKKIDTKEFSTGSQWVEGVGFDPNSTNGEEFDRLTVGNFSLSSGLYWYIPNSDRTTKAYLGFSMFNLTKPTYSFFGAEQEEPFKYVVNAGYEVYKKNRFSVTPQVLYYNSYNRNNWIIGSKWTYQFNVIKESWMFSSGSLDIITDYKLQDGLAIGVQVNQPSFSFGIGYGFANDLNGAYTPEKGTVEISFSIKKSLFREPRKKIVADDIYYQGQDRKLVFKTPEAKLEVEKENVVVKQKVKDVKKEIRRETSKEIKFKLEKDFQFGFNEAELNNEAKAYINDIVLLLSENEMLYIEVIGHTDNVGAKEANQEISEKRAEIVKGYLMEKRIESNRIKTSGEADKYPLNNNDTKENRSKNRRVEFVIYY
jgi:type IX secretion system PorP/SprF family membrane protein